MSTMKPYKRLVDWKQYLLTLLEKGLGYTAATFTVCSGLFFLLLAVFCLWFGAHSGADRNTPIWGAGLMGVLGVAVLSQGRSMFKNAKKVEAVAPITRHNTGLLPEVETLVRASDSPPSQQQTELLRAANCGKGTPAEELLRASIAAERGD